jgi:hypothetical protein
MGSQPKSLLYGAACTPYWLDPYLAQRMAEVAELQTFLKAQPVRDARSPEEILGYDDAGLPG